MIKFIKNLFRKKDLVIDEIDTDSSLDDEIIYGRRSIDLNETPISFKEYCIWHFNAQLLEKIYALKEEKILPKLHEMATYAIETEQYNNENLYVLCLEQWQDETFLKQTVKQLNIDTALPKNKEIVKIICQWIISQESLIAKNLTKSNFKYRFGNIDRDADWHTVNSPIFFSPDHYSDIINNMDLPKEYRKIFEILQNNWHELYTINTWIKAEAHIIELAKNVLLQ